MSTDGLTLNSAPFEAAIVRLAATSKKAAAAVMKDQARLLFVEVATLTPPYSGSTTGRAAEKMGKASVESGIRSIYGTPSAAYDLIAAKDTQQAAAFWFHHRQGDDSTASSILRTTTGKSLSPFDGGALHERFGKGARRRRQRTAATYYVTSEAALTAYIRQIQEHVWWLASGWAEPLRALGAKLPYGVGKLTTPGNLKVTITDQRIEITMANQVSYGRDVRGIQSRINFAMNKRVGALDRRWESYLNRAAKDAGFSKTL
jgi:hypothetical protein